MSKIKQLLYIIIYLIFLNSPAFGTDIYVDLENGNDTTGNGTSTNPYLTINKGDDGLTGGDEVRVAQNNAVTALSGNVTFTNGSAILNTSADLTLELSAGDIISKDTGNEAWWLVLSVSINTITLEYQYWCVSETVTAYVVHPTVNTAVDIIATSGTSVSSRLKVTGGWNLGTQTRDGYTTVRNSTAGNVITISGAYIELSYFKLVPDTGTNAISATGDCVYIHHCYTAESATSESLQFTGQYNIVKYCYISGGVGHIIISGKGDQISDVYIYTYNGAYGSAAVRLYDCSVCYNTYIYNAYGSENYCIQTYYPWIIIDNCTFANSVHGVKLDTDNTIAANCTFDTLSGDAIDLTAGTRHNLIRDCTFTAVSGQDIDDYAVTTHVREASLIDSSDVTNYYGFFKTYKDTANARSGSCLRLSSTNSNVAHRFHIGSIRVTSTGADLTLKIYLKDDSSFNGKVGLLVTQNNNIVSNLIEHQTLTTSYVQKSVLINSGDLILNEYLDLFIYIIDASAGNVYVDDFSYTQ